MFAWRSAALVNRTRRIGPKTCVPLLEIAADSGGSTSCDTQLNCRTLFTTATALLSSPLALCAELTSRFSFVELKFGEMPILTRLFGASTFQEVLTRQSIEFLRLVSASGNLFLDSLLPRVFNFCCSEGGTALAVGLIPPRVVDGSESVAAFGMGFCARSSLSCRKLHWSPF